jgi:hypothetical protein
MSMYFKIQQPSVQKRGTLTKKSKFLGLNLTRYFKLGWEGGSGVLLYSKSAESQKFKKLSLERYKRDHGCFIRHSNDWM